VSILGETRFNECFGNLGAMTETSHNVATHLP